MLKQDEKRILAAEMSLATEDCRG